LPRFLFPPQKTNKRSIWREVKLVFRILQKSVLSLKQLLDRFASISEKLHIENRIKLRPLQLAQLDFI
jgi:hypothetical protein